MSVKRPSALKWAPLICKNGPKDIQLYYDFSDSADGFVLAVTDLCVVWKTTLTRGEIGEHAREQNCSIEPSESITQLRTLLNKLKQSLLEGYNVVGRDSKAAKDSLSIRTRLKLPAPLNWLDWVFRLQQQESAYLAHTVTFPLLREVALMKEQTQTLHQVIKEKDHVLSKLLDKIDRAAIDLTLIFPSMIVMKSRKQKIDVSEASKHVPGMATFDRNTWESGFGRSHNGESSNSTNLSELLAGVNTSTLNGPAATDWIQNLSVLDESTSKGALQDSETDDDALGAKASKSKQPEKVNADDSDSATESDFEDLADTPRRRRQSKKQGGSPESPSSPKVPTRQHSSSDESSPPPRKGRAIESSSGSDSDQPMRNATKTGKKTANKLGLIGGKRKPSPARSSSSRPASSHASTPSRKLGVLGGRKASTKSPSPVPSRTRTEIPAAHDKEGGSDTASSASSTPPSNQPPIEMPVKSPMPPPVKEKKPEPEEIVEEKAKRKREELKRTQAQAHAGAKKKARRF